MQIELITLLSKYSIDCVATAIVVFLVLFLVKKRCYMPEKLNQLLPFCLAFAVYCVAAAIGKISTDIVVSKSFTAGGLATVLYAFAGGFAVRDEEELKNLLKLILHSVVDDDSAEAVADKVFVDLNNIAKDEDGLKTIRISDLIKAYLPENADVDKIEYISAIFIRAFEKLKSKTKKNK